MSDIDKRVLNIAIKEIQEKTDIKNIKIEKIKNGRNIDKLIFTFIVKESSDEENVPQIEAKESSKNKLDISKEVEELKLKIKKIIKKDDYELSAKIIPLITIEELKKFAEENKLNIDWED